ncbi:MAG: polymer-forming cytoskeletal protein [Deltaproteobacteria bacterium]|nr:polymer-forming cytoskeletal protein [Deltaproteobacteria bacterium]
MKKNQDQINAFLGKDTEFEGKLSFSGAVRIDGRFKGEILTDGTLIVGETALLECGIKTVHVSISGEVHGTIDAKSRIEIHAPGKVFGSITAPVVTIDEGVIFEGTCQMQSKTDGEGSKVTILHNDKDS